MRSAGAPPRSRAPSDRFQHDFTEHQPVLREGLRGKARGGTLPPSLRQLPFLCRPGATLPPSSPQRPLRPCHGCLPPGLFALERELESLMGQGARPRTFGKDREWGFPLAPKELKHLGPLCHCLSICAPPRPRQSTEVAHSEGYQGLHCAQRWGRGRVREIWLHVRECLLPWEAPSPPPGCKFPRGSQQLG